MTTYRLADKKCVPCEGGVSKLTPTEAKHFLSQLKDWQINEDCTVISKQVDFKNYFRVMAFVNAVAYIANQENHHPDLEISYNKVIIKYSTHAIAGLSENDFICAVKVDALL